MWQPQVAVTYQSKQTDIKLLRLLMVFADKADENGRIDPAPSQDTLAELFDVSDRTIRSWINLLLDSGELIRTRRGRGDGNPSAYQINLDMSQTGQLTGSYTEAKSDNTSGNIEERLGDLEESIASLREDIARILPVIKNLQEEQEALTGRTGSVNRKGRSFKSADDPLRSNLDPKEEKKIYISPKPPCREDEVTLQELPPEALPDFDDSQRVGEYIEAIGTQVRDYWGAAKNRKKFEEAAYMVIGFDATIELVMGFDSYWQERGWYTTGGKASIDHFVDHWNDYINGVNLKKPTANGKAPAVNDPYFAEIKPVGGRY